MQPLSRFPAVALMCAVACLTACSVLPAPAQPTATATTARLGVPPTATPMPPTEAPTPSATARPTDPVTPFQYPPTVTAPPTACDAAPRPTRLIIMARGIVVDGDPEEVDERVNIREGPSTGNPIVDQLDIGDVFVVIDGPECSTQYAWFQIQVGDVTGWIAEGDREAYYVAPYFPG